MEKDREQKENKEEESLNLEDDLKEPYAEEEPEVGPNGDQQKEDEIEEGDSREEVEVVKERSKVSRFFRKLLIWLVVIVISFGAGIGTFYALRYQPLQQHAEEQSQTIQEAEGEISDLESEIDRLSALEDQNEELQREIDQTRLHITILSARSSVSNALLALSEDNIAEAKLELDKVDRTLDKLETMLNEDQVEVVRNMQQRHELIMEELEEDAFSARSDLEVLSSKLGSLENTLFASP